MKRISLLLIFAAALFLTGCPKKDVPKGAFTGALPNKVTGATPLGIRVQSNSAIDASLLTKIDEGYQSLADKSKAAYGRALQPGQITVGLWPRMKECTNPGFLVPGVLAWDQDPTYDKDPRPGQVLLCVVGLAPAYGNSQGGVWTPGSSYGVLVVADASIIATAVDYELEHETLFAFDIEKWWNTAGVHAHPLIGEGLVSIPNVKPVLVPVTPEFEKFLPKRTIMRDGIKEEEAPKAVFVLVTH